MIDPIVEKWKVNYAENLKRGVFSSPHVSLFSAFTRNILYKNPPVVLVAAGPSLDKNIDLLKEYQDKCLIMCADAVLYRLLESNITPYIVANIDPSESISRFWAGCDTSKSTLVAPTTVSPQVLDVWKGHVVLYNQEDVKGSYKDEVLKMLTKNTSAFGSLMNKFFVGATLFQVATHFNPSVIIFIGYDLSYDNNFKPYCNGFLDRKLYDENNVGMDLLIEREHLGDFTTVVDGKRVRTTKLLHFYKNTLVDLIESSKRNTINATEGGILDTIPRLPLHLALKLYCNDNLKITASSRRNKRRR